MPPSEDDIKFNDININDDSTRIQTEATISVALTSTTEEIKTEEILTSASSEINALTLCSFNCFEQQTKKCRKCQRNYCVLHASRFSPNLCQDCFRNIQIILDKYSRTFEYIAENGQAHYRKESCKEWHLDGPDWPFLNIWIHKMTDEELQEVWMFHFFVMKTIEVENDIRKINRNKQLASMPTPKTKGQLKTTTTRTTKTTAVLTADDVRAKLRKSGITDNNIIEQLVKAAGF